MSQANELTMELKPAAEKQIRRLMRFAADKSFGFRLKVRPGGCSGLAVEFDLAAMPDVNEVVWEDRGLRIFVDSKSCLLLNGSVLDFVDSRSMTGFVVTAPGKDFQACAPASTLLPVESLVRS
jgi:iron-sulfur cluster assembly accessory protein